MSLGATSVGKAKSNPRAAHGEGRAVARAHILDLASKGDLQGIRAFTRTLTDYPLDAADAIAWAEAGTNASINT